MDIDHNQIVEVRGEPWIISRRILHDGCALVWLEGRGAHNFGRAFSVLEPFDRITPVTARRLRQRRHDAVVRHALAAIAGARPSAALWTAAAANIDLLPYQWEPAQAVLAGCTRVLLADEVGLGKTVQAGLILGELQARGLVERALIVVPAGLRGTWARELHDRFNIEARIVDHAALAQLTAVWPPDVNPWSRPGVTIASIDYVKRPEVLAAIEDVPIDIVIADEAHHLTPGSDRGAAVDRLAARASWVVLVSATPHSGDDAAFEYLMNLGRAGDPINVFRRQRHESGRRVERRRRLIAVSPSPTESHLFEAVDQYAQLISRCRGDHDPHVRLIASTLTRRAASSARAICRTLTRRLALLAGDEDPCPRQARLPWEEPDQDEEEESAAVLAAPGLDDPAQERRLIEQLIESARIAEATPSKIRFLVRLLERVREPIVIFTEYRDTLEAIEATLREHRAVALLHGGLIATERQHSVDRFNDGRVDVLIATDTGGEGLNLQHRCRLVVTMELPWNPQRLEQRVGRVDRIGQRRRVHSIHLFHSGTVEDEVLARLERRRIHAERALAATPAAPVNAREMERLRDSRRWRAIAGRSRHHEGWSRPARAWKLATQAIAVYELEHIDLTGDVVERSHTAAIVTFRNGVDVPALVSWLGDHPLAAHAPADPAIALEPLARANLERITSIRRQLARRGSVLGQTSLFDRRAERDAALRGQARRRLDEHLASRAARFQSWIDGQWKTRRRLIAIWPLGTRS